MGQCNDGEVGAGLRQVGQGAGGMDIKKREGAGKALRPQKGQQGLGLGRLCGGIVPLAGKDGDGFGRKKRVEVVLVHGGYFGLSANLVSMSP
jgi:hypothetical protein